MKTSREKTAHLTKSLLESFNSDEWIVAREVAVRGCKGRIDVVAVRQRQYLRKQFRGYEIKVSRSDFLADVGSQKWRKYLAVCHQVYFAAPAGMLRKEEIPHGAGLIVLGDKGWQVVKSAPIHAPENLDADAVLSILFSTTRQEQTRRDKLAILAAQGRLTMTEVAKDIGLEIGRRLAGVSPKTEKNAERIMREVDSLFGSDKDAIAALRFAAVLAPERNLLERVGDFLSGLSRGYHREDPGKLGKSVDFLLDERKKAPIDIGGPSCESTP